MQATRSRKPVQVLLDADQTLTDCSTTCGWAVAASRSISASTAYAVEKLTAIGKLLGVWIKSQLSRSDRFKCVALSVLNRMTMGTLEGCFCSMGRLATCQPKGLPTYMWYTVSGFGLYGDHKRADNFEIRAFSPHWTSHGKQSMKAPKEPVGVFGPKTGH